MPKSRKYVVESGSESGSASGSASGSESEEERPKKKQKKPEKSKAKAGPSSEQDNMLPLAKMRYVSVSDFHGKLYVNIREYYEQDGELKPGRKGIALNKDQWDKLKSHMDEIDSMLDDLS